MAEIRLVVIDFDGTLMDRQDEYALYAGFKKQMDDLRVAQNTLWAVSTGRSPRSFWRRFTPMATAGIEPDFVVTHHAYISRRTQSGFRAHILWNIWMYYLLWKTRSGISSTLDAMHTLATSSIRGSHTVVKRPDRLCLRFDSQNACEVAVDLLKEKVKANSHLMVFRYLSEIDIRSVPFTKGLAVSELGRHLGIGPEHIVTIGNGHNDISMFVPSVARMTGCTVNSEAEVMEAVHEAGGHIASKPALSGVMEIVEAYASGKVRNDLPSWWRPPERRGNPQPAGRGRRPWTRNQKVRLGLLVLVIYIVVVVFANYELIPFSKWIILPFRMVNGLIEKLLVFLLG